MERFRRRGPTHPLARLLATAVLLTMGCDRAPEAEQGVTPQRWAAIPVEHQKGADLFSRHCSACHGIRAAGSENGPPLVHEVYRPGHHADAAFHLAAARGVRAHHWGFGNMPPVPGVSTEEVARIVGYVRWLQREAGIN